MSKRNKIPPAKSKPVKPTDEQQRHIAELRQYLAQLEKRGAPEIEVNNQKRIIADAEKKLVLMVD